jgi:hypothetical protein
VSFFASAHVALQYVFPCSGTQLQEGWAHFDFVVMEGSFSGTCFGSLEEFLRKEAAHCIEQLSVLCWGIRSFALDNRIALALGTIRSILLMIAGYLTIGWNGEVLERSFSPNRIFRAARARSKRGISFCRIPYYLARKRSHENFTGSSNVIELETNCNCGITLGGDP